MRRRSTRTTRPRNCKSFGSELLSLMRRSSMAQWQCCVFQFSTLMISFKPRGLLRIEWQNECLSWPSASHASSMALKQLSKTGVRVPRLSVSWPWQALQTWPSACTLSRCAVEWPSISLSLSSRERKSKVTFNKITVPRSSSCVRLSLCRPSILTRRRVFCHRRASQREQREQAACHRINR